MRSRGHVTVSAAQVIGGRYDHRKRSCDYRAACRWHFIGDSAKRSTDWWPTACGRRCCGRLASCDEALEQEDAHVGKPYPSEEDVHVGKGDPS
jgi:hypothetical protein